MYIVLTNGDLPSDPNKVPKPRAEDETEFYYFFGAAMAAWQDVELFVAVLYGHLLSPAHKAALFASLYEVYSFNTRLGMLDVAIEHRYPNLVPAWQKLSGKISTKSKRRNALAHLTAYFDTSIKQTNRQLFLGQSMLAAPEGSNKKEWISRGAINAAQLREMVTAFTKLRRDLVDFAQQLPEPLVQ
jgi:hypothetical protein